MICFFTELGLQISMEKSTLRPVQSLEFIGTDLDVLQAKVFLPQDRFLFLVSLRCCPQIPASLCLRLLGHMAGSTAMILHARLHMQCLQLWFSSVYRLNRDSLDKPCHYLPGAKTAWNGRRTQPKHAKGSLFYRCQHHHSLPWMHRS